MAGDPVLQEARERISDVDRRIVEAVNERLELVRELWRYKAEHGLPLLAPDREEAMLAELARANRGPLSDEGLRRIQAELLALTRRELGAPG